MCTHCQRAPRDRIAKNAQFGRLPVGRFCRTLIRLAPGVDIPSLFLSLLVLVFSLTVHEAAHAWTADRLGDPTARMLGRVSLNPIVHIDPIGTLLLPLIASVTGAPLLGWAKPVPVRSRGLKNIRRDFMLIAAAGPASNLALATIASIGVRFLGGDDPSPAGGLDVAGPLHFLVQQAFVLNLLLAVFNMIPVPPLDGGNVLASLLPPALSYKFEQVRPYGIFVLYALLLTGALSTIIRPPLGFLVRLLQL
jgi:Zn-dependent protease